MKGEVGVEIRKHKTLEQQIFILSIKAILIKANANRQILDFNLLSDEQIDKNFGPKLMFVRLANKFAFDEKW